MFLRILYIYIDKNVAKNRIYLQYLNDKNDMPLKFWKRLGLYIVLFK